MEGSFQNARVSKPPSCSALCSNEYGDNEMLKVMLIGDSIRLHYQPKVIELMNETATISGPVENCRFSSYTLFHLAAWVPEDNFDVIQWNNGQWDTCHMPDGRIHTSLASYLDIQERIAKILLKKTKRLIFATTTPVWAEQFTSGSIHPRRNEDILDYNSAAVDLLTGLGIEINDLHSPIAADVKKYISKDMVHLTEAGNAVCAARVAELFQHATSVPLDV